jgi:hypothetical protein
LPFVKKNSFNENLKNELRYPSLILIEVGFLKNVKIIKIIIDFCKKAHRNF